jgi:hypothetical protein
MGQCAKILGKNITKIRRDKRASTTDDAYFSGLFMRGEGFEGGKYAVRYVPEWTTVSSFIFSFCSDWKVAAEKVPEKVAISRGAAVLRLRP